MPEREYYAERKGLLNPEPMDLEMLKKAFAWLFQKLEHELYFREATGYECTDKGDIPGRWGSDFEAFFYLKLRRTDIWPIPERAHNYDEPTLFTTIEFLYDYVSEPQNKSYHSWNDCGWHTSDYDRDKGRKRYRDEINEILKDYSSGYRLSDTGEILSISPTGLETLTTEVVETADPKNVDNRIHVAVTKYKRYNAILSDKKDAIRTLADVLEYLKKEGVQLATKDDSDLFHIINSFDIRHHNKAQKGDYDKEIWYDWMFYTFLASIHALLKSKGK